MQVSSREAQAPQAKRPPYTGTFSLSSGFLLSLSSGLKQQSLRLATVTGTGGKTLMFDYRGHER